MDCERCLEIHGQGCTASYRDDQGRELCVFCVDSVICPRQKRILALAAGAPIPTKPAIVPTLENTIALLLQRRRTVAGARQGKAKSDNPTQVEPARPGQACGGSDKLSGLGVKEQQQLSTDEDATMATEIRTCSHAGCGKRLSFNNKTGLCKIHGGDGSHVGSRSAPAPPSGNPSERPKTLPPKGANGHAGHDNGHARGNGHDVEIAARVELVMEKIPIAEKLAFISRWLNGEA
jgi:hypothetical protein